MKLYIDSTNNRKVDLALDSEKFINEYDTPQEQDILSFLHHVLADRGQSLEDIDEIEVNPGPGSFTGSRIGVTIANALAYALNLKVNGKSPPILPVYASPPHITISPSSLSCLGRDRCRTDH